MTYDSAEVVVPPWRIPIIVQIEVSLPLWKRTREVRTVELTYAITTSNDDILDNEVADLIFKHVGRIRTGCDLT